MTLCVAWISRLHNRAGGSQHRAQPRPPLARRIGRAARSVSARRLSPWGFPTWLFPIGDILCSRCHYPRSFKLGTQWRPTSPVSDHPVYGTSVSLTTHITANFPQRTFSA
ncbi:hypothetical protein FHG87_000094 [Trinorchestia longiramus]|nr:hypothetical protein FHG87_000094 [Trinorchestia longiramus]